MGEGFQEMLVPHSTGIYVTYPQYWEPEKSHLRNLLVFAPAKPTCTAKEGGKTVLPPHSGSSKAQPPQSPGERTQATMSLPARDLLRHCLGYACAKLHGNVECILLHQDRHFHEARWLIDQSPQTDISSWISHSRGQILPIAEDYLQP